MRELALFAGAGGGILGGVLLGWRTVCAVEINPYCARLLMQRQNEGHLPPFPIWDNVCFFDGRPWKGIADVVSGGFPCQDISSAGKRKGLSGEHSGLWQEMARIISEVRPPYVLIENSSHLRARGLVRALKDLTSMGYDASWGVLGARACGAPHRRDRMWIAACSDDERRRAPIGPDGTGKGEHQGSPLASANPHSQPLWLEQGRISRTNGTDQAQPGAPHWWSLDILQGVDDGMAHRMERVRATGEGQVPAVARLAWEVLGP